MTLLLACIRAAGEADLALAAGWDGVVVDADAERPASPLVGRLGRGTFTLEADARTERFAVQTDLSLAPDEGDAPPAGLLLRSDGRLLGAGLWPALASAVEQAKARGLRVAVAGGLEAPDIPRLMMLGPDLLLVGRAARRDGRADAPLDPARLQALRALVPRSLPGTEAPAVRPLRPDRIFVRDLVVALDVGAYASEHGRTQSVRFSAEAELVPAAGPARSMADVVSYDLIADTIRRRAAGQRAEWLETLAEDIATTLLAVPRIAAVTVRVEKLDLGAGAFGVEIARVRQAEPGTAAG